MSKHLIKIENPKHCAISVAHEGLDNQYCESGEVVAIDWQPSSGWGLEEAHYTDEDGNVVSIDLSLREFTMPAKAIVVSGTAKRFFAQDWTTGDVPVGIFGTIMIPLPDEPQIDDEISIGDVVVTGFKDLKTALEYIINKTAGGVLVQFRKNDVWFTAGSTQISKPGSSIHITCYTNAFNTNDASGFELLIGLEIPYVDGQLGDKLTIFSFDFVEG